MTDHQKFDAQYGYGAQWKKLENDLICQEIHAERVGMCIDSGMTEQQAEALAFVEVQKFKAKEKANEKMQ